MDNNKTDAPASTKSSMLKLILSALAAAFGVQSRANLEHDFKQQSIVPFIITGLVLTGLLIVGLYCIVSLVMRYAT